MRFEIFSHYTALSKYASKMILQALRAKPSSLVCIATGYSPKHTYQLFADYEKAHPGYLNRMKIIQLDEWIGLPQTHPSSCTYFIQKQLVTPLKISHENVFLFDGASAFPEDECQRADRFLDEFGPIDICILGIGQNGHLGFNEPAGSFTTRTHVVSLQPETRNHQMVKSLDSRPTIGISLGIGDILKSKQIILIITGKKKKTALKRLREKKITPNFPASVLWQHPNAICLVDGELAAISFEFDRYGHR